MTHTITIPQQVYASGTYGPFAVDGFVSATTEYLEVQFTVVNWPAATPILRGSMRWNTGDGIDFSINSPPRNRDGSLQAVATARVNVPRLADGKAAVSSGTLTITTLVTLTTSVSLVTG